MLGKNPGSIPILSGIWVEQVIPSKPVKEDKRKYLTEVLQKNDSEV